MLKTRHWDRIGNGGITFTELGFGCAPIANLYRALTDDEAQAVLEAAWAAGIRYFDTAPLYGLGLSETRVNRFLRGKKRGDYVISTKIGRLFRTATPETRDGFGKWFDVPSRNEIYDYSYDGTLRSLEFSLERLGLDSVDILFAHDLDLFNHDTQARLDGKLAEFMAGGYRALLRMRDEGVIKAFGAGVNDWRPCQWLTERGDFDLFLLAGRYTLLEQEALATFLPLAQSRGIGIVIGGPYNSGLLATPRAKRAAEGAWYNYNPAPPQVLAQADRIEDACDRHGVRMVDAAFQFCLRHPAVVSVIPGAQGIAEVEGNLRAAGAEVPAALWTALKEQGLMRQDAPA